MNMDPCLNIVPIARFRSPFPEKFGIPRQAGLAPSLRGTIIFEPGFRSPDAIRGLDGFEYIWLLWGFSDAVRKTHFPPPLGVQGGGRSGRTVAFQATVRPPRLGGNERVGVFASRSPFRPNPIGLSSVKLGSIVHDGKDEDGSPLGPVIEVLGADLMDDTPIYDIKPYIPYADSHPEARAGFVDALPKETLEVVFPEGVSLPPGLDFSALGEVLSLDPRPRYHDDPSRIYGMAFEGHEVRFRVDGSVIRVLEIT